MILTCPACNTSYTVKDGAIPPQGRTVRCAACKHSWHQAGLAPEPVGEAQVAPLSEAPVGRVAEAPVEPSFGGSDEPVAAVAPDAVDDEPVDETAESDAYASLTSMRKPELGAERAALVEPALVESEVAEPEVVAPSPVEPQPEVAAPVAEDHGWIDSPTYADDEPTPRRRGPLILLALVVLIAALAAAAYFLAPREWMARAGLAEASANSPLKLMVTSQTRQKLASGNDLVSLSGRVINPTEASEPVPALQADLRDGAGKLVYSWMIPPPAARLEPRASASFNAAELGVPANATSLTLRWAS